MGLAIAGIMSLLPGLLQSGIGISQMIKGAGKPTQEEPVYKVPREVEDALKVSQQQALSDMPGYGLAKSNLEQSMASSLTRGQESASSGSDLLGYTAGMGVAQNRGLNQLGAQNATYHQNAQNQYKNQLMQSAGYRDKEFQDRLRRYNEEADALAAYKGGGLQNLMGGLGGGIKNYLSYDATSQYLDMLKGGGKAPNPLIGGGLMSPTQSTVGSPSDGSQINLGTRQSNPYNPFDLWGNNQGGGNQGGYDPNDLSDPNNPDNPMNATNSLINGGNYNDYLHSLWGGNKKY